MDEIVVPVLLTLSDYLDVLAGDPSHFLLGEEA